MRRARDPFDELFRRMFRGSFFSGDPFFEEEDLSIDRGSSRGGLVREALSDVRENDDEVIVTFELPGMERDDIDLRIQDDYIEIKAKKQKTKEKKDKNSFSSSISSSAFYQKIPLPAIVDKDSADATYKNGILELRLKKIDKTPKGKKIQIK
jgi:HSP20 family protein